jgi:hypothetical protein
VRTWAGAHPAATSNSRRIEDSKIEDLTIDLKIEN